MLRLFRELRSLWRSYQDFGVQEFAALRRQRELMEAEVAQVRARREALEKLTAEATLQRVRDLAASAEHVRERHVEDQAAVMQAIERTAAAAEAALVQRVSEQQVEQLAAVGRLTQQVLDGSAATLDGLRPPPVADGDSSTDRAGDRREPESR